ncbi:hypothetical protein TNCV_2590471 [Trichonephila clavipes]|nr:hypothetical protein TNCV_2590471 [Trichonephila clavipes]
MRIKFAEAHCSLGIVLGEVVRLLAQLNIEEYPPESHIKNYTSLHYKDMVEDVGFTVVYCKQVQNVTTFPSDEIYASK